MNDTFVKLILSTKVSNDECKNVDFLARGVANIANNNLKFNYATLILINSTIICGVSEVMKFFSKTVVILNNTTKPIRRQSKQFILFGYTLENILYLLQWMNKYKYDNTGIFFIICQSNQIEECDEYEAVRILWNYKIVNVIFMNLSAEGTGYSYHIDESCGNGPPLKIDNWDDCCKFGKKCTRKFPIKFKNLHGCPIIVSTFRQLPFMELNNGVPSGADGDLLLILIKALNASLIIRTPSIGDGWGNRGENNTWVGSLGDLYYDLANISMTSSSITVTRSEDFQMSKSYFYHRLVWITHPKIKEAPTNKLKRPFNSSSRKALILFFIVFIFIILISKTKVCKAIFKRVTIVRMPNNNLFYYFQICLGQPVVIQTKKTKILSFLLIWIFYCFLIRTFYQVHLISSLKTDVYLSDFRSIYDAIRDKYSFGGSPSLSDFYIDEPQVYNNWIGLNSSQYFEIMDNLTKGSKFVLATNVATIKFYLKQPAKQLHILPQKIVSSPTVLFFRKFSPLAPAINLIISRLAEYGIPEMLFKNATTSKFLYEPEDDDKAINFEDCAGCFISLIIGYIVSFVVLIVEICVHFCFK